MDEEGEKVVLHIYDISNGMASSLSRVFLGKHIEGIWHTGVVVYGYEYFFGGGIQKDIPARTPFGTPTRVIEMGTTYLPQALFEGFLSEISSRFTVETYSLMSHNCNNFSDEVAFFLTGQHIPPYITGLPDEVRNSPLGPIIIPILNRLEDNMRSQVSSHPAIPQPAQTQSVQAQPGPSPPPQPEATLPRTPSIPSAPASAPTPAHRHKSLKLQLIKGSDSKPLLFSATPSLSLIQQMRPYLHSRPSTGADALVSPLATLSTSNQSQAATPAATEVDKPTPPVVEPPPPANGQPGGVGLEAGVSQEELDVLDSLGKMLESVNNPSWQSTSYVPPKTYQVLGRLLKDWPLSLRSLPVSLLQLLVLHPDANKHFSRHDDEHTVAQLLKQCSKRAQGASAANQPKALLAATLALAANLFAHRTGAAYVLSSRCINSAIDMAVSSLDDSDPAIRHSAATLLYNCSIYLPKDDSDAVIDTLCALIQNVQDRQQLPVDQAHQEFVLRMLLAIGHLLYCNHTALELAKSLGLSVSAFLDHPYQQLCHAATDIQLLLAAP